jgi:hypothetical protein
MQFCWIGLQIETKNAGAVVLRRRLFNKNMQVEAAKTRFADFGNSP